MGILTNLLMTECLATKDCTNLKKKDHSNLVDVCKKIGSAIGYILSSAIVSVAVGLIINSVVALLLSAGGPASSFVFFFQKFFSICLLYAAVLFFFFMYGGLMMLCGGGLP